jgi:hypothetical protein
MTQALAHDVVQVAACVRADVRFSITVRQDRSIRRAIAFITDSQVELVQAENTTANTRSSNRSTLI